SPKTNTRNLLPNYQKTIYTENVTAPGTTNQQQPPGDPTGAGQMATVPLNDGLTFTGTTTSSRPLRFLFGREQRES
ncbi:MAG TPA: hypothetical protein VG297_19020, partial [Bryobacteraceae bacterium]|nr:hypothetical protein [Bryobacteraceae bacterium]